MQALFSLTSSESKRLLGKAVASLPEVRQAMRRGYLVIGRGSTNAFVLEELLGKPVDKARYVAGQIIRGLPCVLAAGERSQPVTFHRGEVLAVEPGEVVEKLAPGDLLIKGANAVDAQGHVGVLMGGAGGGTMGQFYLALKAQGVETIYPVGLEKLIPSVEVAAHYGGRLKIGRSLGCRAGMACVADGRVVTEIEAIDTLFGVQAIHFASGGWGGAEGAVTLLVEGDDDEVHRCLDEIEKIKGEPPLPAVKSPCKTCGALCPFQGKAEEALPAWLR